MLKRLISVALFITLIVAVCLPIMATDEPVKLSLWTHQRHMMDLVTELNAEFNKTVGKEKGIEIELKVITDNVAQIFQAAQRNDAGPDIFNVMTGNNGFEADYKAGDKIYFDDLPGFAEWKKQWPSWYWKENSTTWKGHVYAIPMTLYNARIIYNKDLFKEAGVTKIPKSYGELREAAKKITALGKGKFGFAYPGKENWFVEWMPSQLAEANGEPCWFDWKTGRFNFKGYQKVFQLILDMKKDGSIFPGATSMGNDSLRAQFAAGNIGMIMGESWDVGVLNDQFPAKCDWGLINPNPTYDGKFHGKSRAMISEGLWSINGKSKYKELAWEVVKWYTSYKVRAKFYEEGKFTPPDPVVFKYAEKQPTAKGYAEFAQAAADDYVTTYPDYPGFVNPSENPIDTFNGVLAKGGNLGKELARIDKVWNDALDKYYKEHPESDRRWNIYPNFDRTKGTMGSPAIIKK